MKNLMTDEEFELFIKINFFFFHLFNIEWVETFRPWARCKKSDEDKKKKNTTKFKME